MAKRAVAQTSNIDEDPWWPTSVLARKTGGRVVGTNHSVWLYMKAPLAPVVDARSPHEAMLAGEPVRTVLEEIAATAQIRVNRRSVAKSEYRDIHLLLVNVPVPFSLPAGAELRAHLSASFGGTNVIERVLLVGVRLKDKLGGDGGWRSAVDSVTETLSRGGVPLSDFDEDFRAMSAIMTRSGLQSMTDRDFNLANAWWNQGRSPDTPMLVHDDHLHVFTSTDSMHSAARLVERGETECDEWVLAQHHTLTFGTVQDFAIGHPEATSRAAQWASSLVHAGAVCVSIRGKLEPPAVTRAELRRGKKKFLDDIAERQSQNKMARAEQEELLAELDELESFYAVGGPATLMDCSTVVATSGRVGQRGHDMSEFAPGSGLEMLTMVSRQNQALAETWLASPVRANPYLHDLPSVTLSSAGLSGLSAVGDRDGAMLGFTEMDRQPAFLSPTAAGDEDQVPIAVVVGQSGSGKALPLSARVPTPSGWTTMGQLKVGDTVFGDDGEVCAVREIFDHDLLTMYDVHVSDGQVITACEDHQWLVSNRRDRDKVHHPTRTAAQSNRRSAQVLVGDLTALAEQYSDSEMLTSGELLVAMSHLDIPWKAPTEVSAALDFIDCPSDYATRVWSAPLALKYLALRLSTMFSEEPRAFAEQRVLSTKEILVSGVKQSEFSIAVTGALQLPEADLAVDPYVLGRWLGGGSSSGGQIAQGTEAVVLDNKHILVTYLRASESQRLALLQGLMDTAGAVDRVGSCELRFRDETLAHDSLELVRSLGIRATISSSDAANTEPDQFTNNRIVFRLPRKAARLAEDVRETQEWLYITDITPAPSEPGRCITVDSPNHTFLIEGFVPTHNTMTMLYLADQFARIPSPAGGPTPVIIVDPKLGSDHSAVVEAAGGTVASLDDLLSADGIFDPIRFSANRANGSELAASMLTQINPWGPDLSQYEVPVQRAISFGVEQGADCVGLALHMALEAGVAPADMVAKVDDLAESSPMFRACVGFQKGGRRLRAGDGITLIKVGNAHLDLPAPGQDAREVNINQRIALALVRMMVFGSAAALAMRSGVLMLDEAWVMLGAGRTEVERLGRLARSQQVLPMLFTQRITDALNAGLSGYISRGIILPIQDPDEAVAACQIFKLEPTPERLERITGRASLGAAFAEDGVAPNWNSMRALRDPRTGEVLRGAVGIYVDLAGRAVPVEIVLPASFLRLSSTNPDDIRRREAERGRLQPPEESRV